MEKIIQIASGTEGDKDSFETEIVGLTDQGNVYRLKYNIETKQYIIPTPSPK